MKERQRIIDIHNEGFPFRGIDLKGVFQEELSTLPEFQEQAQGLIRQFGDLIEGNTWGMVLCDRDQPRDWPPDPQPAQYVTEVKAIAKWWGLYIWAEGCDVIHQAADYIQSDSMAAYGDGTPTPEIFKISLEIIFTSEQGLRTIKDAMLNGLEEDYNSLREEYGGRVNVKPGPKDEPKNLRRNVRLYLLKHLLESNRTSSSPRQVIREYNARGWPPSLNEDTDKGMVDKAIKDIRKKLREHGGTKF